MAAATSFESWVGSEASIGTEQLGSIWDYVQLGGVYLPGVCTVDDFEYGQDIDVQKKRRKEKARLRDNGLAPCGFTITVELTAADWPEWVKVLPSIQPRRAGAVRTPLKIVHPVVNVSGVEDVYVHKIHYEAPTARRGMVIRIKVAEWFEEEKDTKPQSKKPKSASVGYRRPDYAGDPNELAETLYRNQYPIAPTDADEILSNSFSPEGNDRFNQTP